MTTSQSTFHVIENFSGVTDRGARLNPKSKSVLRLQPVHFALTGGLPVSDFKNATR
jgi:hypothetical protein